jgi:hypothetical protein
LGVGITRDIGRFAVYLRLYWYRSHSSVSSAAGLGCEAMIEGRKGGNIDEAGRLVRSGLGTGELRGNFLPA